MNSKKINYGTEGEYFFPDDNKFFLIKAADKYDIYAVTEFYENPNNISYSKIYSFDKQHKDFLFMLPFLYNCNELECRLKKYYDFAMSSEYSIEQAEKKVNSLLVSLKKIHPFFQHEYLALKFLWNSVKDYLDKSSEHRFLQYFFPLFSGAFTDFTKILESGNRTQFANDVLKKYSDYVIQYSSIFYNDSERPFVYNVLTPIYRMLYPQKVDYYNKTGFEKFIMPAFKKKYTESYSNFLTFMRQDMKQEIEDNYSKLPMFFQLEAVKKILEEYFFIFSKLPQICNSVNVFQQYALLLTNSPTLSMNMKSCHFYSSHESLNMVIKYHLRKICTKTAIEYDDNLARVATNDLYRKIKNSPSMSMDKDYISKTLENAYPGRIETYLNTEITELHNIKQLFILELLDIARENVIIKKCPLCECYFITPSKKIMYCEQHRGKHDAHQTKYTNTNKQTETGKMYTKYYNCLSQRIHRMEQSDDKGTFESANSNFRKWQNEASDLKERYDPSTSSLKEFKDALDKICVTYGFKPPHRYRIS